MRAEKQRSHKGESIAKCNNKCEDYGGPLSPPIEGTCPICEHLVTFFQVLLEWALRFLQIVPSKFKI